MKSYHEFKAEMEAIQREMVEASLDGVDALAQ